MNFSLSKSLKKKSVFAAVFLGILILGFLLRITYISSEEYWFDEVLSMEISRYTESLTHLTKFLQHGEYHPPLYYYVMFFWTRWFGTDPLSTRSFSLIFGMLSIVLLYFFAKKLFNKEVAIVSSFLLAINPLHIEFSKEARPYTFFTFFGLLSCYFLLFLLEKRKWYFWAGFILSNLVGLYIHYSYIFILAAEIVVLFVVVFLRNYSSSSFNISFSFKELIFFAGTMMVGFLPWVSTFIKRYMESRSVLYGISPGFNRVLYASPEDILESLLWLTKYTLSKSEEIMLFVGKIVLLIFLIYFIKFYHQKALLIKHKLLFLVFLIIIPITTLIVTDVGMQYTELPFRHILFSVFPFIIVIAWVIVEYKENRYKYVVLFIFFLSIFSMLPQVLKNDSAAVLNHRAKELAQYISKRELPGDLIFFDHHLRHIVFHYYYKGENKIGYFFPFQNSETNYELTNSVLNSLETKLMIHSPLPNKDTEDQLWRSLDGYKRVWLMYSFNATLVKYLLENGWRLAEFPDLEDPDIAYNIMPMLFVKEL